jgi:hypothetical protein
MPRPRTYGFDSDTLAYAARVKAGSGVTILPEPLKQLNKFVLGVKKLGLWNSMVCWPMRSIHNAGKGTVIYSLGGLGIFNGSIADITQWTSNGITLRTNTPTFTSLTYIPNNFTGTMCCVGGLFTVPNQRLIGHNINAGGWMVGTVSTNTSWFNYFDTVRSTVFYGGSIGSSNIRDFIAFSGFSRNVVGSTTTYVSNPNVIGSNYGTTTQTLTGLTTNTSSTYMGSGMNSFLIHINNNIFQQIDYKSLETLLRNTLFSDRLFQWVY